MKHEAVIFRVKQDRAGAVFPFDKVYFFKKDAESMLPRIFPSAFVLFPDEQFVKMMRNVIMPWADKDEMQCAIGNIHPMARGDERVLKERVRKQDPFREITDNYQEYIAVVPMLFLRSKNISKTAVDPETKEPPVYPEYVRASINNAAAPSDKYFPHRTRPRGIQNTRAMMAIATRRAYFLSDGKTYSPICIVCPRSLFMLSGQCHFGDTECYGSLAQTKPGEFQKNMRKYKEWAGRLEEPEVGDAV